MTHVIPAFLHRGVEVAFTCPRGKAAAVGGRANGTELDKKKLRNEHRFTCQRGGEWRAEEEGQEDLGGGGGELGPCICECCTIVANARYWQRSVIRHTFPSLSSLTLDPKGPTAWSHHFRLRN